MDAMVANLVALRAELRVTHANVAEVERKLDLLLEGLGGVAAGCARAAPAPETVVGGGGVWEAAASWVWILLPALRSPVLALCLCVWGGIGQNQGRAVLAAMAMLVADPLGALVWLGALAGEAIMGLLRRLRCWTRQPVGVGGGPGHPMEMAEAGDPAANGADVPVARPWWHRAALGAVRGVMQVGNE